MTLSQLQGCLYVEGLAVKDGFLREHAWVELDGRIVDPTPAYLEGPPAAYFPALRYTVGDAIKTLHAKSPVLEPGVPPLGLRFGGRNTSEYRAANEAAVRYTVAC
jgi:hypothetical protein